MFGIRKESIDDYPQRVDIEGLGDKDLDSRIAAMQNASDINPHKNALRRERVQRSIARMGLDEAERRLGSAPMNHDDPNEYPENNVQIGES